jgi:hypothetical protein
MIPLCRWAAALALVVLLAGCSGRGNVSGTVKYDGQPLAGGTITFYDARNSTASSAIDKDGKYSVSGLATGPVKVSLAVPVAVPFMASSVPGAKADRPAIKAPALPAKYLDPQASGLGFELSRGNQTKDFDLKP